MAVRKIKKCRRSGTGAALVRASLLVGPLALAIVMGIAPRSERTVAANGQDGLDMMATGSVKPSSFSFAVGGPTAPTQIGPCLRFPDGSQRGAC